VIIGADVGGTFTDVVAIRDGLLTTAKVPTSAPQSLAVTHAVTRLAAGEIVRSLVHGTTVATNALLERRGAHTILITDTGFEDLIEIARQDRPSLYDPFSDRPTPLVARSDRVGVSPGDEVPPLADPEAIAIVMVRAHVDPSEEERVYELVRAALPGVPVSLSSRVAPEFREYERLSTTVLNAYLTPPTAGYLEDLEDELAGGRLVDSVSVMRSSGGLMSIPDAAALPAAILLSGPAGGVVAARSVARDMGLPSVISFDMGGTSTDVCLIEDDAIDVSYERSIDGYACRLPSVGIHTVGAGGGSIAWVDGGGALRVGPQSAGAVPGPACYDRGGVLPTVTDADVVLGRIDAGATLGGSVTISVERAREVIGALGRRLGMSVDEVALGVCRIAEEVMAGAVRTVSVDQGADPGSAHLVAFGGAGGLHATSVARSLGMVGVLVPRHAGVFSALGLLAAPPRADAASAVFVDGPRQMDEITSRGRILAAATTAEIVAAGHEPQRTELWVDARYVGQSHEITVPLAPGSGFEAIVDAFEAAHLRRNGFSRKGDPVEVVTVRSATFGPPPLAHDIITEPTGQPSGRPYRRAVVSADGQLVDADVVPRGTLAAGDVVVGPAVIEEAEATTFVDVGERCDVRDNGALEVTW
jgi:N-methylhydantoinase A